MNYDKLESQDNCTTLKNKGDEVRVTLYANRKGWLEKILIRTEGADPDYVWVSLQCKGMIVYTDVPASMLKGLSPWPDAETADLLVRQSIYVDFKLMIDAEVTVEAHAWMSLPPRERR